MRERRCATWDGGKITWGGRSRVIEYLVPLTRSSLPPSVQQLWEQLVKECYSQTISCNPTHCIVADGNTFLRFWDNIQGYVLAATVNYNQGNSGYHPLSVANKILPPGELKAITTQIGLVLDGPFVPMPHPFINPEEDERADETLTDPELAENTIRVSPPFVQKAKPHSLRNYVVDQRDSRHPHIPYPLRMNQENTLLSNKEILLELTNTPLNENCSTVILKKLPEKLGDPGKFLFSCGFSELKCKALADLGARTNLMPLSVWKNLGLPELISTRMTLELANRAICTPARIVRDVFVLVGKFTLSVDLVIVDYESNPRVPFILGRPFLRTARALIDVHEEEMILRDGDERLTLYMRHDTSSYSNQPHKESINMINIYNDSYEDYLEDLFAINHLSGNLTFSSHTDLTSSKVTNPLSDPNNDHVGTIPEMFTDEHTLYYSSPPLYDDVDDDLVELESNNDDVYNDPFDFMEDKIKESKLLIDELDPPRSNKIKESKLLIDELDPPRSSDILPSPSMTRFSMRIFSSIAGGLDHVNPVIRLPIECGISRVLRVSQDAVLLHMFPFTLTGSAKRWVDKLTPGAVNTWDVLKKAFIQRYCPPSKTAKRLKDIHNFKQESDALYQAWERYNDLLYKCPIHDIKNHQKLNIFYKGVNTMNRQLLDSQGLIARMTPTQALTTI
uniref:Retrotransposon gag domain-containing protein n=1 Tax=Tanacetum cinerariifolium TaxID=118510 RepID=A0A699H2J0_TANCI|nr:hypothetical protein [Tanacetum cinerariifolium]